MKVSIVTTTINIPVLLTKYAQNAKFYGHRDVEFIVIGDRKSPSGTAEFCEKIAKEYYPCTYLDIPAQEEYLSNNPKLWKHLRFDSIQRRNIAMLMAHEHGSEVIITIDDDNFVMDQDFVKLHSIVGGIQNVPAYGSTSGWFNVCSVLDTEDNVRFYHRGFPQKQRWRESSAFTSVYPIERRIAVNAGLWLDNPDIDALTRIERQPVVRGYRPGFEGSFALVPGTWSPFNSQNTALAREVIPAYFLSPYIGRYDDIWASYIVQRIAEHLGDAISFGNPLVRQERNPHDLWKDLDVERNGMILTDEFCEALRAISLRGTSYHECFGELGSQLGQLWKEGTQWTQSQKEWRSQLIQGLEIWHECDWRFAVGARAA